VEQAPGRRILKVTSILYLILGVVGILALVSAEAELVPEGRHLFGILSLGYSVFLAVMGLWCCANREKAKLLCVLVVVRVGLSLLDFVHLLAATGPTWARALDLPLLLLLPSIFLVGAVKNLPEKSA